MTPRFVVPPIEQFRYAPGQMLKSKDFNNNQHLKNMLRWIHNTALHNAWGVASGFDVSIKHAPIPGDGPREPDKVCVSPGVAYDKFGREIVLAQKAEFEQPDGTEAFLVIKLKTSMNGTSRAWHVCSTVGSLPLFGEPEFHWRLGDEIDFGLEIPIGVFDGHSQTIERFIGAEARAQARPYIAFGATQRGLTEWQKFNIPAEGENITIGLQVEIDASDAGFTEIPCYFAWLDSYDFDLENPLLFPSISLANEKTDGFTFQMLLFGGRQGEAQGTTTPDLTDLNIGKAAISPQIANDMKLSVCWMGIKLNF